MRQTAIVDPNLSLPPALKLYLIVVGDGKKFDELQSTRSQTNTGTLTDEDIADENTSITKESSGPCFTVEEAAVELDVPEDVVRCLLTLHAYQISQTQLFVFAGSVLVFGREQLPL